MENLSRRRALKLGAALGLAAVALDAPKAWSWSSSGSLAGTDTVTDPFAVWDPVPDEVAARILADGATASVNSAWKTWVNNGDPLPAGMPDYLKSYLQQVNQLPSWADPALLAASEKLYKRLSMYLFLSLSLGSGILSTVIPREARAVYWSAGGADMKARAAKTFTFGYDLAAANTWTPAGHFVVTANKTRLVHSTVRNLLPTSTHFQSGSDQPKPISNGDILRTFHSTATFTHLNMAKWHISLSNAEQAADLHAWQVALHLLGVQRQFIPASWSDAVAQAEQMLWPDLGPTTEGTSLAKTLLGYIEQPTLGLDTGFVSEMVRYLIGDTYCNWLGLPHDYFSRGVIEVGWPLYVAFREGTSWFMPANYYLFDQFVRGVAMLFLNNGTSATQTPVTLPSANRPGA
ncbi:oxygenase MpaB family protein [Yinghuangia seranimata]|uniref:oxygenase MpaB family protein n=1 Tax=Yinghuangia seranimata TaxID=408067 RepID=UPI00248C8558|nr:oxygenase MpaB family protein [Yinghuangia seranimata]MDI2128387.1 oxygenase MpaB family protein [Yinghuangia seranimata]